MMGSGVRIPLAAPRHHPPKSDSVHQATEKPLFFPIMPSSTIRYRRLTSGDFVGLIVGLEGQHRTRGQHMTLTDTAIRRTRPIDGRTIKLSDGGGLSFGLCRAARGYGTSPIGSPANSASSPSALIPGSRSRMPARVAKMPSANWQPVSILANRNGSPSSPRPPRNHRSPCPPSRHFRPLPSVAPMPVRNFGMNGSR
jgi:hypothetical protein